MRPVLEELARKFEGKVSVRFVNLRDLETVPLAEAHRITLLPTQVFLDSEGKERFRHEGFLPLADLEAELGRLGWTR